MILAILQHATGRDQYGRPRGKAEYRNHFWTYRGSTDWPACVVAHAQGLMHVDPPNDQLGGGYLFWVSDAGREYMLANSPKPPAGKRRWS